MADLSPEEWFDKLEQRFTAETRPQWLDNKTRPCEPRPRHEQMDLLWSYYVGDAPLPQVAPEYEEVFRDIMRKSRCNPAEMCVSAVVARMELQGVSTKLDGDANGDDIANEIMENSGFAAQFKDIEVFKSAMGESFGMVVPAPKDSKEKPTIHAIDPRRCVGIDHPFNPLWLRAALVKSYDVATGEEVAHMFLPGKKYTRTREGSAEWSAMADPEDVKDLDDLGGIPVVKFENPLCMGEYEGHIDLLDKLIDVTLQSMVLIRYQAFRPTATIGDEPEDNEYDDESTDYSQGDYEPPPSLDAVDRPTKPQVTDFKAVLKAGPGEVWKLPDGWKIWQGQQADVAGMLQMKRDTEKEFAAYSHTPLYLITPDDANGSAEGAGLLREALTSKCRDRRSRDVPRVKLLWRIAFAMSGEKARGDQIKLRWGPLEFKSLAEKASASSQATGVLSKQRIMRDIWEMPPEDIAENIAELEVDRVMAEAAAARAAAQQQPAPQPNPPNNGPTGKPQPRPAPVKNDPAAVA